MRSNAHTPVLLVEGKGEYRVLTRLLELHGFLPGQPGYPMINHDGDGSDRGGGYPKLLERTRTNARRDLNLGIVFDADTSPAEQWARVATTIAEVVRDHTLPRALPAHGMILERVDLPGRKLGVWMMPDNKAPGMLEDFIASLIPEQDRCWPHARDSTTRARTEFGAPLREIHQTKGAMHAWLAWQDPSGKPFTSVLSGDSLRPHAPAAVAFVDWFRRLFDVSPLRRGT